MHPSFIRTGHRPWPMPSRPWTMNQAWCDLLFAHWPIDTNCLRRLIPETLEVQTFEGTAWIGVVPFRMERVRPRFFPSVPGISAFPELNVRTYVTHQGRPGVWFLSLDATNFFGVTLGRYLYDLPYYRARMSLREDRSGIDYYCRRRKDPSVLFRGRYRPVGSPYEARPGTLEHWLTERYCLYAWSRPSRGGGGVLGRCDVHHVPWPLQAAEAEIDENTMAAPHGLTLEGPPALLHFARTLEVAVWPLEKISVGSD